MSPLKCVAKWGDREARIGVRRLSLGCDHRGPERRLEASSSALMNVAGERLPSQHVALSRFCESTPVAAFLT